MDAMDRFGQELVLAGAARRATPRSLARASSGHRRGAAIGACARRARRARARARHRRDHARGERNDPHRLAGRHGTCPIATAGEGIPVAGGSRLLPLRAPDPAGGLPWGMRIIHTTRGLICVQIGRVYHNQLGQLGVDGAFHNDGRFHPLPTDALPDVLANAAGWMPETARVREKSTRATAWGSAQRRHQPPQGRRGTRRPPRDLLRAARSARGERHLSRRLEDTHPPGAPGLGRVSDRAALQQRQAAGKRQRDRRQRRTGQPQLTGRPNGALTAITYSYAGRSCVDRGNLRLASCGLSEVPPPRPAAPPIVHEPLHAKLADPQPRDHERTDKFPSALPRHECRRELFSDGAGLPTRPRRRRLARRRRARGRS